MTDDGDNKQNDFRRQEGWGQLALSLWNQIPKQKQDQLQMALLDAVKSFGTKAGATPKEDEGDDRNEVEE